MPGRNVDRNRKRGPSAAASSVATVALADIDDSGHLTRESPDRWDVDTSTTPALSAGDLDARWDQAEGAGEETPGGSTPTPDQDVVEEIGRAMGIMYRDDEELRCGEKERERDHHRWELDPASSEDYLDRSRNERTGSPPGSRRKKPRRTSRS